VKKKNKAIAMKTFVSFFSRTISEKKLILEFKITVLRFHTLTYIFYNFHPFLVSFKSNILKPQD